MKLDNIKRLLSEDFNQKDKELVEKLAYVINNFMEQVIELSDKNVDLMNLKDDIVTFDIKVDEDGVPIGNAKFKSKVYRPTGLSVINHVNLDDADAPLAMPVIEYSSSSDICVISRIVGLIEDNKYRLTVRVFSGS